MRLTAELINNSLSYLNPLKERELDLRERAQLTNATRFSWDVTGHKIPNIENLAVAGQHDAIDLTDNDLTNLTNFPLSPRLNTLLLARNRIQAIDRRIAEALPNLTTVMLANNNIRELSDLEGFSRCPKLTHVVLLENPVVRKEHYRLWMIWSNPSLRFLDYKKVREAEREEAQELFGTFKEPSELAASIRGTKSKTFEAGTVNGRAPAGGKTFRAVLSETEKKRVQEMLQNAKSMAEIDRIEKDLAEGRIPRGAADTDRMVP